MAMIYSAPSGAYGLSTRLWQAYKVDNYNSLIRKSIADFQKLNEAFNSPDDKVIDQSKAVFLPVKDVIEVIGKRAEPWQNKIEFIADSLNIPLEYAQEILGAGDGEIAVDPAAAEKYIADLEFNDAYKADIEGKIDAMPENMQTQAPDALDAKRLREVMRVGSRGVTAKEYKESFLNKVMMRGQSVLDADTPFGESARKVQKAMYNDLVNIRGQSQDLAKAEARLYAAHIARMADEVGMTPEAYDAAHGLSIDGQPKAGRRSKQPSVMRDPEGNIATDRMAGPFGQQVGNDEASRQAAGEEAGDARVAAKKLLSSPKRKGIEAQELYREAKKKALAEGKSNKDAQESGLNAVIDSMQKSDSTPNEAKIDLAARAEIIRQIQELEPVQVTPTEMLTDVEAKAKTKSFGMMENQTDKRQVFLSVETVGKLFGQGSFKISTIFSDLKKLYETSLPAWSEPEIIREGHKGHPNVKAFHHYVNKFTDETGTYYIRFTVREVGPTKKGISRSPSDSHVHSTIISDVTVYKEEMALSQNEFRNHRGELERGPFIDKRLQDFFDSVKSFNEENTQGRPIEGGSDRLNQDGQSGQTETRPRGSIIINPDTGQGFVSLYEKADKSTFVHEMAHWMAFNMRRIAEQNGAGEAFVNDWNTLKEFIGWQDGQQEFTKEQQEMLARSFEAYLMEGRAPSTALGRVFSKFKNWLKKIYKEISALNAPINDEVRGVFSRMLARDDEIAVKQELDISVGQMAQDYAMREQLIQDLINVGVMNETAWKAYHEGSADGYAEAKAQYEELRKKQGGEHKRRQEIRNIVRIIKGALRDNSIDSYKRDDIAQLVEAYDLKRRTKSEMEIIAEIDSYLADTEEQSADLEGYPGEKPQYLKKEMLQKMTLGELLKLKGQVEYLVREGREIHRLKEAAFREMVDKTALAVLGRVPDTPREMKIIARHEDVSRKSGVGEKAYSLILEPNRLIDWIEGGFGKFDGPLSQLFNWKVNEAKDNELRHRSRRIDHIQRVMMENGVDLKTLASERVVVGCQCRGGGFSEYFQLTGADRRDRLGGCQAQLLDRRFVEFHLSLAGARHARDKLLVSVLQGWETVRCVREAFQQHAG